jgi:hypothetical protein
MTDRIDITIPISCRTANRVKQITVFLSVGIFLVFMATLVRATYNINPGIGIFLGGLWVVLVVALVWLALLINNVHINCKKDNNGV